MCPKNKAPPPPPPTPPPPGPPPLQSPQTSLNGVPVGTNLNTDEWTTGLCGCCEDPANCVITFCCPCITFGQNVEIMDRGATSCPCAAGVCYMLAHWCCACCCYTCTYRSKLRGQFSLRAAPCPDFLVHCCCTYCAFCQEYRELKNRGFDPSIGWAANADKANRAVATMPPVYAPGMTR